MGKKGKKMRSDAKKMKKKTERARKKAYYESLRFSGNNSKSRSQRKAKKRRGFGEKNKHTINDCGNIGCQRCHYKERKPEVVLSLTETVKFINETYPSPIAHVHVHSGIKRPIHLYPR